MPPAPFFFSNYARFRVRIPFEFIFTLARFHPYSSSHPFHHTLFFTFSLCSCSLYRIYNTNAKMNAAAWQRQWLPQWRRQINHHHIAAGHAISATTTSYLTTATHRSPLYRSMIHQRFLSSVAAAGGHDGTGDKGVSPWIDSVKVTGA